MTRQIEMRPPAATKNWIRVNLVECLASIEAINRALPFADETTDSVPLLRIQSAMRVLVEESQVIGLVRVKREQVVKAK